MKNVARLIASLAAVVLFFGSGSAALRQSPAAARWVTAWSASQQALGTVALTNATVRMIARVTIPGDALRIRIDNTFGAAPLMIGKAYVGQRIQGANLAEGSNRQIFFNKAGGAAVPAGGSLTSDPV